MVEFLEMAKLVNDDVAKVFFGKMDNLIIEVQISGFRAAPPPRLLVADGNPAEAEIIYPIEFLKFPFRERPCLFPVFQILPAA